MKYFQRLIKSICMITVFMLVSTYAALSAMADELPVPYKSEGNSSFVISNPVSRIEVGDEAYVNITGSDLPNDLYAYELWIRFDDSFLTYKSDKSSKDSCIKVDNYNNGLLKIGFSGTTAADTLSVGSTLATIKFLAKKSGTAKVSLEKAITLSSSMSYSEYENINESVSLTIAAKTTNNSSGGGSSGGGGGYFGSSVGVIGNTNSLMGISPTMVPIDSAQPTDEPEIFNDLSGVEWAKDAVYELYNMGIVNGYNDGGYHPNDNITRAEFSKIICSAFNILTPAEGERDNFADINPSDWYAPYIYAAKSANFINGYEDGCFKPNNNITREEAAAILGRTLESLEINLPADRLNINFVDETEISDFAVGYIDKLYMLALINGDDNNMFRPSVNLSRAETAQMIWNVLSRIDNADDENSVVSYKADKKSYNNLEYDDLNSDITEVTESPVSSDEPHYTAEPSPEPTEYDEPTSTPLSEPIYTDEPTMISTPSPTFKADKVFECESLDELYEYNNIYAYLIPNDGSRDAFYDDFTTYQRVGDDDANIVFSVPYAERIEVVSYFYAGEELIDFTFETSVDGEVWDEAEFNADYHAEDGKWTKAVYDINTDCTKYFKIKYPNTVNWWTPLVSQISVSFCEPSADSVRIDGSNMLTIPRYDSAEYKYEGYVIDKIGEKFDNDVKFSIYGEVPQGITVDDDGTVYVSNDATDNTELILRCECSKYNLSTDFTVTLKKAVLGDLNNDAAVDSTDLDLSVKLFAKDESSSCWKQYRDADINCDGTINIVDIGFISRTAAIFAEKGDDSIE